MQDPRVWRGPRPSVAVAADDGGSSAPPSPFAPLAHEITVTPQTARTVVRSLKELARLETAQIRAEGGDRPRRISQKHLHGPWR